MIRICLIAALSLSVLVTGCSSAGESNAPLLDTSFDPTLMAAPSTPDACANHEAGCPCDYPGATTECGRVKRVAGDYVWCSTGKQTCSEDGAWGKCSGDQLAAAPVTER